MSMDSGRTMSYLEMYVYITNALEILECQQLKPVSHPLHDLINIDGDSPQLSPQEASNFHNGLGMLG